MKFKLLLLIFVVSSLFLCQVSRATGEQSGEIAKCETGKNILIDLSGSLPSNCKSCQGGYQISSIPNNVPQSISTSVVYENQPNSMLVTVSYCTYFETQIRNGAVKPIIQCYESDSDNTGKQCNLTRAITWSDVKGVL